MIELCIGCGAMFERLEGPTHAYMLSTPACWSAYGQVLLREYEDPALFATSHRLTVDAYALQHPGAPGDRRAEQSMWLHFTSLQLIIRHQRPHSAGALAMKKLAGITFPPLPRPDALTVTVKDVIDAEPGLHHERVLAWAIDAHSAWRRLEPSAEMLIAEL